MKEEDEAFVTTAEEIITSVLCLCSPASRLSVRTLMKEKSTAPSSWWPPSSTAWSISAAPGITKRTPPLIWRPRKPNGRYFGKERRLETFGK